MKLPPPSGARVRWPRFGLTGTVQYNIDKLGLTAVLWDEPPPASYGKGNPAAVLTEWLEIVEEGEADEQVQAEYRRCPGTI